MSGGNDNYTKRQIRYIIAEVYTGFCVGGPGSNGGTFCIGELKDFAFFQTRKFSKKLKIQWKNYNFLKICKEMLRILGKFRESLENFGNMDF